jgi:hypothetical protein
VFDEKMLAVSLYGDKMEQVRRGIEACVQILRIETYTNHERPKQVPTDVRDLAITKVKEFLNELKPFEETV